jgi:hypothetical protein
VVVSRDHVGYYLFVYPLDLEVIEFLKLGELYTTRGGQVQEALIDNEFLCRVFVKEIFLFHFEEDKGEGDEGIDGKSPFFSVHGSQLGEEDYISHIRGDKLPQTVTSRNGIIRSPR